MLAGTSPPTIRRRRKPTLAGREGSWAAGLLGLWYVMHADAPQLDATWVCSIVSLEVADPASQRLGAKNSLVSGHRKNCGRP